jgi:arginine metabolism regulation protein II
MKRSIQLIDQVSEARRKTSTASIPDSIAQQCDHLENELLDWDVNDYLPLPDSSSESQINANTNIIRFQTLAFYNALIIHLSQHIRLLNHRFLHPYIEAVIHNIEEIEKMKTRKQMIGAPVYWPVFIAASEAYDKRLQERFRRWYDEVERYGIEAVKTGVQVIYQVWDEGPQANRTTCAWRNITQKARITLMLT